MNMKKIFGVRTKKRILEKDSPSDVTSQIPGARKAV